MSSEERNTWIYAVVAFIVPAVYAAYVVSQLPDIDVADFSFQRPLLTAIGASLVVSFVAQTFFGAGRDRRDQRDRDISRHGEYVGFYVLAVGMLPAFVLALLESAYFWIANAIYLAYILNALTSSTVKLIAYRRGL